MPGFAPPPPLVLHIVHRFDTGGLENGIVNLIDHMPAHAYRHAVVAITEITDFRRRIGRRDVSFHALHKPPGQGFWVYPRLWRLLRGARPAIVHTRNLGALEFQLPAWAAGVPGRVHSEHGRDTDDLDGTRLKPMLLRRAYRPFVQQQIALSQDLERYLEHAVGVPRARLGQIYNGVDSVRFAPAAGGRARIEGCPFGAPGEWIVGSVGRMAAVKNPLLLARAFVRARATAPALAPRLKLAMVGGGPLHEEVRTLLERAGAAASAWLPGERGDVQEIMRGLDCFVLPSLAEGVSNTILEAMASGLPVIATRVGGNAELVEHGETGELVASDDDEALAAAIVRLAGDRDRVRAYGRAGRAAVERRFSMQSMVAAYRALYDRVLAQSPAVQTVS